MTLLAPLGLFGLLAVPAIVLLWLLHSRFRSERVPSLLLWEDVPAPLAASHAWRLPRIELLLLLQILAAAALAFALSRPAIDGLGGRHVALVLDASASMRATDVPPSRFDAARQLLVEVLDSASAADQFNLVIGGSQPRVVVRNETGAAIRTALHQAQVGDVGGDLTTAVSVAAEPGISEVIVATDGATPFDAPPLAAAVTFRLVGGQPDQLALSDVSVRQPIDGSDRLAGFARVANFTAGARSTVVQVIADSVLIDSRAISVEPLSRNEVTFSVPTNTHALRVALAGTDTHIDVAPPRPRPLLIVSETPALWTRALPSARSIAPSDYRAPASGEIVLFDGWLPPDLPDVERILVNPADPFLTRELTAPREISLRDVDRTDPLLRGVDLASLTISSTGRAAVPEWASLTAGTPTDFVLGHGLLNGHRTVVFAFDPSTSTLPQLAAFPLLVANAVDWLSANRGDIAHAGLGTAVDITPHVLQPIAATTDGIRSPDWFEIWPYLASFAVLLMFFEVGLAFHRKLTSPLAATVSAVAAVAVALALWQPGLWLPDRGMTVVFAVDRSASISPQSQSALAAWVDQAKRLKPATDRVDTLDSGRDGTDIAQALRSAAALARGQGAGRIVLLSDGHATTGDLDAALQSLGGIPVDVVPLYGLPSPPALVLESMEVPAYVRAGDAFDATLVVGSTDATSIPLRVSLDGTVIKDQQVSLNPGHNRLTLGLSIDAVGFHRLSVTARGNAVQGFVIIKPAERVLVIEERAGESAGLLAVLRGKRDMVDVRAPGAVGALSQLEPYDAVVLANVSATSFTLDQQRTLRTLVRERGRGLLALGGSTSFVLGSYEGTVLEQVLPVLSSIPPRREDARLALLLVIDISQSMDRVVDGVSGIDMAKQAAILASRALRDDDQVGVLIFNHRFSWLQPIARLGDIGRAPLETNIASLTPSGGTEIFAALDEGATKMRAGQADLRHIVLFTDGNSRDANYDTLTAPLRADHIGLSTVGLGPEADTRLLAKLAKDGQGRFYYSDRPSELPRILAREVAIAKRTAVVEGSIQPRLVAPSPILRSIAPDTLPSLGGYIATTSRTTAQVVLASEDDKPLLAQWRVGLGRAVAWTSDVAGNWTRLWTDWNQAALFWQQVLSWLAGVPIQPDFVLDVSASGETAHIMLDDLRDDQFVDLASPIASVSGPSGTEVPLVLQQSAPGRYEATVIASQPGVYAVKVVDGQRSETSGFVVREKPEQAAFGADEQTLRRIASDTGGRVVMNAAQAFRDEGRQNGQRWQPVWRFLVGLALVLLVIGLVARRLSPSSPVSGFVAAVAARVRRRSGLRRVRR
jgi:Ca-activated chloride channel family protein